MNTTNKTQRELKEIQEKLKILNSKVQALQKNKLEYHIIDNADFIQLMKISNNTARNWRNKGIIPFSQIENKIYYKVADIEKLLANNYHL